MASLTEPPAHIAPAKLFRLMIQRPRPVLATPFVFAGLDVGPLFVRALKNQEIAAALDAAEGVSLPEIRTGRVLCGLIARALVLADGSVLFRTAQHVADTLDERECERLGVEVGRTLWWVAPTYARSDSAAWHRALTKGAQEGMNLHDAIVLGQSIDVALGAGRKQVTPRPDRYFGCPLADLTDGQWMAFRAARTVVEERSPNGRRS